MKPNISSIYHRLNYGNSRTVKRTVQSSLQHLGFGGAVNLREYYRLMLAIGLHVFAWGRRQRDWSVEDWKRVKWRDESRFLLLNSNRMLRIGHQTQQAMEPACQVGTV
ncbi:hypothetical protein TNCV_512421 [Trichonephila clavipes]|nr:hypothetical protein TNCV_512421 [Trichonephila clavipes]